MTTSRIRTVVSGTGALLALIVVIAGVPMWLHTEAGSPVPNSIPDLDQIWTALTRRDDGTLLLHLLKYAAWAGWALFVWGVVADVVTRLRGLPTPSLGPQQRLASRLVSAVVALAVSLPTAMTASAAPPIATATTYEATAVSADGGGADGARQTAASVDAEEQNTYEEYTVRGGDCLWDIAWNELGEPERWPEIYQASRSVAQPEGRHLSDPDLILPGWVLNIPVPATSRDGNGVEDADAELPPAPRPQTDQPTTPEPTNVVTPLFGPARAPTPMTRPTEGSSGLGQPIATPLNASPSTTVSAVEERWISALAEHDHAIARRGDWRSRLGSAH